MFREREILNEITALLSEDGTLRWVETVPEFMVPKGSSVAYALDDFGYVIGLRLLSVSRSQSAILDLICQLSQLEALVLDFTIPTAIPEKLFNLSRLAFLWFGSNVVSLPQKIIEMRLPIMGEEEYKRVMDDWAGKGENRLGWASLIQLVESFEAEKAPRVKKPRSVAPGHTSVRELLPQEIKTQARRLRALVIASEIIADPPLEIVLRGHDAVVHFYDERSTGLRSLNELKVVLVGMGGSGKTSLVRRLLGEPFNPIESQTHGINIRPTEITVGGLGAVTVHFWDFGGQEIMHATHQFFLSKRCLYVLVLDGRKEEDPEYWLQHVESFGGDSPVLVVLNKIDEHPAFDVNRRFLSTKYAGIRDFYRVSCASGSGFKELQKALKVEIGKVPILRTQWPKNWFVVKQKLENLNAAYISLEHYNRLCLEAGIVNPESRETLVDFLHDLGVVLHFRDLELLDTHVLDPHWVTEAVYRIITSELLARQKGFLGIHQIGTALEPSDRSVPHHVYSIDKFRYIVDLMLKFELCYRLSGDAILVPDLLDIQEPEVALPGTNLIRFVFEYSYLPKSVILRLIVRMHGDIKSDMRWRTGVVLEDKSLAAIALVRADENGKQISVMVGGAQTRDYFSIIRKVIRDINASFEKLNVAEKVPLPDAPDVLIDYRDLVGYENAGRDEIFIGRLGKTYEVATLLNGLEKREFRGPVANFAVNVAGSVIAPSVGLVAKTSVLNQLSTRGQVNMDYTPAVWEKMVAYFTATLVVGLVGYLLVRNEKFADPNLVVLLRIILSVSVALLGATIPGMLKVDLSLKGVTIRALGALALFVITFVLTPQVL